MPSSPILQEWLETDGHGGYASLSAAMGPTRRYHGLLVANLPGCGPHVMLQRLDLSLILADGRKIELAEATYHDGVRHHHGGDAVVSFTHEPFAQTTWQAEGFTVRMGVLMPRQETPWLGDGATCPGAEILVRVEVLEHPPGAQARLRLRMMTPARSAHALTRENFALNPRAEMEGRHLIFQPYASLPPLVIEPEPPLPFHHSPDWHQGVAYPADVARGYDGTEDVFSPGFFEFPAQGHVTLRAGISTSHQLPGDLWENALYAARLRPRPLGLDPCVFLADLPGQGPSLIAGYPWFGAWGRDTAISVPGLCFAQGKLEDGLDLLASLLSRAPRGLVANLFGNDGTGADNAVDATLLTLWACGEYLRFGGDIRTLSARCGGDILRILDLWLRSEAPHVSINLHGLPETGDSRTNFTWMDAKVDGIPITPRPGTPVEIAALWLHALALGERIARAANLPMPHHCAEALAEGKKNFDRLFFLPEQGYLADVICQDGRADTRLRPNQLWAIWLGLEGGFLPLDHAKSALIRVGEHLLTPMGLRTLAPASQGYCPRYAGPPAHRDQAYHQGTVWPWLTGIYISAVLAVAAQSGKKVNASALLDYFDALFAESPSERGGYGGITEVCDAQDPHLPEGCPWQAWSAAEVLRAHALLTAPPAPVPPHPLETMSA